MSILRNNCPVPFDQQPLNEYLALKRSWLFSWSTYEIKDFSSTILFVFSSLFIYWGLILIFLFINQISLYKICIIDLLIVNTILFFIFIRLYLGWSYIVKRLLSATIFYEESGWYDGQIWIKTAASLTQDRLVGLYQILPYLIRIRYTCFILCFIFLLIYCLYRFL
uniref:Ycf36 n=1 Tax=Acrosorium ciliolatum TaxID=1550622 RepID=A0A1Z1M1R9_9FLOR|nr:hypothetical protein [Acrosorium ciliolatum]ARW60019.1 hypothetical protein [Acrosorium ciliolatum]